MFVHDGPVYRDADGCYYEFAYHNLYKRYSYLASSILFMMRAKKMKGTGHFTKIPEEIRIVAVPNIKSPKGMLSGYYSGKEIVKRTIAECDIVVIRLPSTYGEIAWSICQQLGKPYIVECVGCAWDGYWNHSLLGKAVAPFAYYRTKYIIKRSKYIYYVTKQFLQKRYPANPDAVTVSCSNVEIEDPGNEVFEKRLAKINNHRAGGKLVLGTAAAIDTRYKGQEYVIRAIAKLASHGIDIEYRLAGGRTRDDGNTYLTDLSKRLGVESRVSLCGPLSQAEMASFYDGLDIYVQPSKQEGLPRSVIEAMSRACPVLGSDIAGIPELLEDECLFEPGDVDGICESIVSMLDKATMRTAAKRNFAAACDYYRPVLDRKRMEFYDKFLAENGQA